jgi:hypothetical protein
MKKLLLGGVFSLVMLAGALTLGRHVFAQNSSGRLTLTTSPLPISITTRPGQTVVTELRIQNSGTSTEKIKANLMKFKASGEEGNPGLVDREAGDDYFDWVEFSPQEFTAEPNVWQTVKMTIKVPKEAALGYYFAVVFGRANAETPDSESQTSVQGATATLVLLEVEVPSAKRKVKATDFKVGKNVYEFLPADFTVRLMNEGNIHTAPSGNVFISKGGKQIAVLKINEAKGNILPNSARNFTTNWSDGFPRYDEATENGEVKLDSDGRPKRRLRWDFADLSRLRFGKYTATLVMAYDDNGRDVPIEAAVSFWIIPWRLIAAGILIPWVPAVLVFVLMRKRSSKKRWRHEG